MEILGKIGRENRKTKWARVSRDSWHPLSSKLGYTSTKGTLGICLCSTIERMPGDRPSRRLDTSLAILTRVLRFEASRCARIPSPLAEPPVLVFWLN
jgi:hypothetical protein